MTLYRKKTKPIRAVQITSMDINDLPDWVQEAQESEEILVHYPKYLPLPIGFIPFNDDSPGAEEWILGQWVLDVSGVCHDIDCMLVSNEYFIENYEPVDA